MKKTFKVILNILTWLLIIFLFAYCIFLYYFKNNEIVFFNKIKNNTITKEINTEFETIKDMPNYAFFDMIYFGKNTNDKYTIILKAYTKDKSKYIEYSIKNYTFTKNIGKDHIQLYKVTERN